MSLATFLAKEFGQDVLTKEAKATKTEKTLQLVLMRGLPGSGKSTLAAKLVYEAEQKGLVGKTFAADDYFINDGKFVYDHTKIHDAHVWNEKRAAEAMENKVDLVIIDNTNSMAWEMRRYVEAAKKYGYAISFQEPKTWWKNDVRVCCEKNTKSVPIDVIQKIKSRFERNPSVDKILLATKGR